MQTFIAWLQRRFYNFRDGHGVYLAYILSFANFAVITYALAIERIPSLSQLFPSMILWSLFFFLLYIPSAILVGYYVHLKRQFPTEVEVQTKHNPFNYKALPGKEQEYGLPLQIVFLKFTTKSMKIQNAIAHTLDCIINNKRPFVKIPYRTDEDMSEFQKWIEFTELLRQGYDVASTKQRIKE